jgi:hypothetical protein
MWTIKMWGSQSWLQPPFQAALAGHFYKTRRSHAPGKKASSRHAAQ